MTTRANISPGFRWRLLVVALACLLYAGWSAYDGFVAYPRINETAGIFEKYKLDFPETWNKDSEDFRNTWKNYAREHGYPENDKEAGQHKDDLSMIAQYVQLAITLPIGLIFAYGFLGTMGRWIESDESGIATVRRERVPYDSIKRLDKRRWEKKGIAVVTYDAGGSDKRLVIDDWKYDRVPTDQILRDVEAHIDRELIVGGDPEPELVEVASESQDEEQGATEEAKSS